MDFFVIHFACFLRIRKRFRGAVAHEPVGAEKRGGAGPRSEVRCDRGDAIAHPDPRPQTRCLGDRTLRPNGSRQRLVTDVPPKVYPKVWVTVNMLHEPRALGIAVAKDLQNLTVVRSERIQEIWELLPFRRAVVAIDVLDVERGDDRIQDQALHFWIDDVHRSGPTLQSEGVGSHAQPDRRAARIADAEFVRVQTKHVAERHQRLDVELAGIDSGLKYLGTHEVAHPMQLRLSDVRELEAALAALRGVGFVRH